MEIIDDKSLIENTDVESNIEKFDGDDSEGTSKDNKDEHVEEVAREDEYNLKLQPSTMPNGAESNHNQEVDNDDDELESARAEMGRVREENKRLKSSLALRMKDYKDLQMHFLHVVQKQETKTNDDHEQGSDSGEALVSLSLGRTSSNASTHDMTTKKNNDRNNNEAAGLELELGFRSFEPMVNDHNDEVSETTCPPGKVLKTREDHDVITQQLMTSHLKKARVVVRARCDAPTLNDGCQWRKYGQKIAKGNPCPRAYYRCTISPSCPVRKQVQRCAEDMSILITTYEGNHNHPLPMSATAMASTTSAAASMLQSHSSTSQQGLNNSTMASISSSTINNNPLSHLPNFTNTSLSQNASRFYFPNTTISTNNSHPTVTLDLTSPPPSQFGLRFPPVTFPRYSSKSLNFSTPSSSSSFDHNNTLQQSPNCINNVGYYNNVATFPHENRMMTSQLAVGGSAFNIENKPAFQHHVFTETTIATATKAITSSPKFQSALAAALTTFVGTKKGSNGGAIREDGNVVNASSSSSSSSSSSGSSGLKLNKSAGT